MSDFNNLSSVSLNELMGRIQDSNQTKQAQSHEEQDFGDTISDFIEAVNDAQQISDQKVSDVIQGKSDNLHEAMASLEEARLSFNLMVEIRNRLLEAYKEIERMQV